MLGSSAGSMAGAAILCVLQALSTLTSPSINESTGLESDGEQEQEEQATMKKLHVALEPLWQELSDCISVTETQLGQLLSYHVKYKCWGAYPGDLFFISSSSWNPETLALH
jgi:hypothetical protein